MSIKKNIIAFAALASLALAADLAAIPAAAFAQGTTSAVPQVNLNDSAFHLTVCDGPALPSTMSAYVAQFQKQYNRAYVPCDFQHLMIQLQYLINVMLAAGVLGAVILIAYAGALYIKGGEGDIKKARGMFPKIFWGFIIMLTAWFIVYQILTWLTGSATNLLGS